MASVPRNEFVQNLTRLGLGIPFDSDSNENNQVVFMYGDASALPRNYRRASSEAGNQAIAPLVSVEAATENCDVVSVAVIGASDDNLRRCHALVGHQGVDGYHLHRLMRLRPPKPNSLTAGSLDPEAPLRLVSRLHFRDGEHAGPTPSEKQSKLFRTVLGRYLDNLDRVLEKLRPVVSAAAMNNTVVVMTCNFGQSEILMNFACGARRRNLDLSPVVVFAADPETRDLAMGLGLRTFYDETNLGFVPREAAKGVGDAVFGAMVRYME
jgi:hypothetical protein